MSGKAVKFNETDPEVFHYEQTQLPEEEKKKEQSQERKDWFMDYIAISMGIRRPVKLLDEVSFEGVAKFIADKKCSNIITMAGAGISTSAGIPDYRSPGTGLFDLLKDKYPNIQSVEDLFNIQFFLRDPKPFFERSRRFFEISLKPTPCHYFVRLLHEKGLLLRHFTQNIDTLERLAGLPADKVVEAHGSYYISNCIDCGAEYSFRWMEERVLKDEVPRCEEEDCNGVIKPDIVMFGEPLQSRFGQLAEQDTLNCDLLIIMGTALAVQPFASLTSKVKTSTPRLFINMDRAKTAKKHPISDVMFGGGFEFDSEDNYRDVFKKAKCDDAVYEMADIIGFGDELRTLVKTEHQRIDAEDLARGKKPVPPVLEEADTGTSSPTASSPSARSAAKKSPWVDTPKVGKTVSTAGKTNSKGGTTDGKKSSVPNATKPRSGTSGIVSSGKSAATANSKAGAASTRLKPASDPSTGSSSPKTSAARTTGAKNSTAPQGKGKELATSAKK